MVKIKKIIRTALILCLMFCASITANAIETTSFPVTVDKDYTRSLEACSYLNEMRIENGRQPLIIDPKLTEIAMQRAAECVIVFNHIRPSSGMVSTLIPGSYSEEGYLQIGADENLSTGGPYAENTIYAWSKSEGHRRPMMDYDNRYCGIGCVWVDKTYYIWSLVLTEKPLQAGTVLPGTRRNTYAVDVDLSRLKFALFNPFGLDNPGDFEFGTIAPSKIAIEDFYEPRRTTYTPPVSMLTFRSNNPDIFTLTPEGYIKPVSIGSGTMTVTLKGTDIGNDIAVRVIPKQLNQNDTMDMDIRIYEYDGNPVCPSVTLVKDEYGNILKEGIDYTIEYQNNNAPGTGKVVCVGINNYAGSISKNLYIDPPQVEPSVTQEQDRKFTVKVKKTVCIYDGFEKTPGVTVKINDKTIPTTNYSVTYKNNKNVGKATVTVKGKGTYKGYIGNAAFKIRYPALRCELKKSSFHYTGKEICPTETVYDENNRIMKRGVDYEITYEDNVEPGLAWVYIHRISNGKWNPDQFSDCAVFDIQNTPTKNKNFTVKVKTASYTYTGKAKKPKVTVQQGKKTISSKYYTVSYKDNKSVGTGTVTVKGKGTYKGCSGKAAFKIQFSKPSLSSVKGGKKALTLKWKKDTQAQGYQVQYSASSKFKGAKTLKVPGKTKTGTAIKSLKSKKTYYVRIRKYKKVGKSYRYSGWSSPKKAKTK